MSDYTQSTAFGPKDSLITGDPNKKIKGSEFDTEFGNLETSISSKANKVSGAVSGNLVSQTSTGDIQDSGETVSSITASVTPPGVILMYVVATAPTGWLLCDGAAVSRSTYASLFAVIGTAYGVGNGSTTFNVPDLKGRVPVGYGAGTGLTSRALSDSGGEETHALTEAEGPTHSHGLRVNIRQIDGDASEGDGSVLTSSAYSSGYIEPSGSGDAHNNMQPFLVVNYIIRT